MIETVWKSSAVLAGVLALVSASAAAAEDADEWFAVRSRHFVIFTDAAPERGGEIARSLELFRSVFARLAPGLELKNPTPTKIIAFRDAEVYAPYKPRPDGGGNVILGYFLRHPDGNFLTLDAGNELVGAFAVIYHEFVHYLVDHNFPEVPRWFNEGLAEYYSTFAVRDGHVELGRPVERHVRWLTYDNRDRRLQWLSHDFSLSQVLSGEAGQHSRKVGGFYAFSWALVHYLLSGGPERLDRTADYLVRLRGGEDPEEALERAFDVRLSDLEETLRDYAVKGRLDAFANPVSGRDFAEAFPTSIVPVDDVGADSRVFAERLPPQEILFHLGDLLARMGRLEWAERHFQKARELDPTRAEAYAGLALVRDYEGRFDEAAVLYRDALERGSRDPLTYLRYGRHLIARLIPEESRTLVAGRLSAVGSLVSTSELATADELRSAGELGTARQAFAAAVELDPDFAHARLLFGVSHLLGEVEAKPGIAALEKVRLWLPDDDESAFFLLQLLLKNEELDEAKGLYDRVFRDSAEPESARRAEEEIERAALLHRAREALDEGAADEALNLLDEAIAVTSDQTLRDRLAQRLADLQERYPAP